jgi:Na+/proline symporter
MRLVKFYVFVLSAMLVNLLGTFSILVICCLCGFVAYAYYFGCDPLLTGKISKYDQILPYFVVDLFQNFYGLPGIFIACIYSAALSTISSGLNSLSAVFLHDFIHPLNFHLKDEHLSHKKSLIATNCLGKTY